MTRYELEAIQEWLMKNASSFDFNDGTPSYGYIDARLVKDLHLAMPDDDVRATVFDDIITYDDVESILCDGLADENAFEHVGYNRDDYVKARNKLLIDGAKEDDLTLELVQTKMLDMGFKLILKESGGKRHELSKGNLMQGFEKELMSIMKKRHCNKLHALELLFEGDFFDFERVLQRAVGIYDDID